MEPPCLLSLSASASRSVSILSSLSCASVAIFHSFAAVSRMKVLQSPSPTSQLNSLLSGKRKKILLMLRIRDVLYIAVCIHPVRFDAFMEYCIFFTQFPGLPGSPSSPGRPLWPCRRIKNMAWQIQLVCQLEPVACRMTFTFGPGAPWMPGCPCIHLQEGLPPVRPITAYPPHCNGHIGNHVTPHILHTYH